MSLLEELLKNYEHLIEEVKLIPSDGGKFEVTVNGQLLYSKLATHRHANIVPYQSFQASDAWFVLAVGNEKQFEKLCEVIGKWEVAYDPRFLTNARRVENRDLLISILKPIFLTRTSREWLSMLEAAGIPCVVASQLEI